MTLALIGLGILLIMILPLCVGLVMLTRWPVRSAPKGQPPIKARLGDRAIAVVRSSTGAVRVHHSRSEEKRHDSRA